MNVEDEYRQLTDAMSVSERVRRAEALFRWSRDYLARSIRATHGPMSEARLKRELALRQYGADPTARRLIHEWPVRVPDCDLRGHRVAPGVYLCELAAAGGHLAKRMIVTH